MKRLVVVILFLSLCIIIGVPSNKIQFEHPNNGEIHLPLNSLIESFGLQICDQETISKQNKKKNYKKIKKGIKSFIKRFNQYKEDRSMSLFTNEKYFFDKVHNQCLLPVSIPGSDLIEITGTELKAVELGDENIYCLNDIPGGFIKPTDFYSYVSNIQAYLEAIKSKNKVKGIKRQLINSERGSREYKILKKKLRAAILDRNNNKLLMSYSEIFQDICKLSVNDNASRFNESEHESGEIPFITPEPFPSGYQTPKIEKPIAKLEEAISLTPEEIYKLVSEIPNEERPELTESEGAEVSGFSINTTSRQDVLRSFHRYYLSSEIANGAEGWTGNVGNCIAGTLSQDTHDKTLRRVNYFRAMSGLPSDIYFTAGKNQASQAAALVMARENDLSHDPNRSFPDNPCLSDDATVGAALGNLGLSTVSNPNMIDQYMYDADGDDIAVGHRRWILYTRARNMGNGYIPHNINHIPEPSFIHNAASALWVIGDFKPEGPSIEIKYPNEGYVPYLVAPRADRFNVRWSFGYPGAGFGNATVTMTESGNTISIPKVTKGNGFGDNTIVWEPDLSEYSWPREDTTFQVTINGVSHAPQSTYTYDVTFIDPYKLNDEVIISGSSSPITEASNHYTFNSIEYADSYRLRTSRVEFKNWTEGAELSPIPRIVDNTHVGYNLYTSDLVNTGSRAFHLTIPGYQYDNQNFVIDRLLVPSANSRLEFVNRFRYVALATELTAEISIDNGETWNNLWSRFGDARSSSGSEFTWETEWQPVSIDIPSEYEGKAVLIRFNFKHNNSAFTGTNDQLGAFVDDIRLTNSIEHILESTEIFPGNSTSFQFIPSQFGTTYVFQIQPEIEGHYFDYGPAKVVTSTEPLPNTRPIADAGQAQTITLPNNMVILDGSNSFDAEQSSDTLTYTWTGSNISENGMTPTIFFDQPGMYEISLVVTDSQGESSTNESTVTITVNPEALEIISSAPDGDIPFDDSVNLYVQTNRNANCRFSQTDLPYETMPYDFFITGEKQHAEPMTVIEGQTYNFYVHCQDTEHPSNKTANATLISFTVEETVEDTIEITFGWPTSQLDPTTSTSLYIETNITASCRYSESNIAFDNMIDSLDPRVSQTIHTKRIDVTPGESYEYFVHCQSTDSPNNVTQVATHLSFSIGSTFEITKQPLSLTVIDGLLATFSVETNVPENELSYEWYKNDVRLFGHTTSKLSIIDASTRDLGDYHVKIFRFQNGQIIDVLESEKATLDFLDIDRLGGVIESISPHAQTVQVGQSATISVQTNLNPDDLIFYWYKNGRLLLEHIYSPTITIPSVDLSDDNSFYQVAVFSKEGLHLWVDVSDRSAINVVP